MKSLILASAAISLRDFGLFALDDCVNLRVYKTNKDESIYYGKNRLSQKGMRKREKWVGK